MRLVTRLAMALFGQVGDQVGQVMDQVGQGQAQELDNIEQYRPLFKPIFCLKMIINHKIVLK